MKRTIIVTTILLLSIKLMAQDIYLTRDSVGMKKLAESILSMAKHKYKYVSTVKDINGFYNISYIQDTNISEKNTFNLWYKIVMVGENKDLEIKGDPFYRMTTIKGKFLDLYSYWKSEINPSAVDKTVLAFGKDDAFISGGSGFRKKRQFFLQKEREYWEINFYDR